MSETETIGDAVVDSVGLPSTINGFHLEPRCRVCRDDTVRTKVNDLLAVGSSYAMVLRAVGEDNAAEGKPDRVTIDSIRNHAARHFPVQQVARATYREIVERRAREARIDFENAVATALTPIAFYECAMNQAFQRLVNGNVDISVETGLRAAEKLQALIDAREAGVDTAAMLADMGRIVEVVRTFVPSERWPEVQAALRGNAYVRCPEPDRPVGDVRMVAINDNPDDDY
jgi:hypothetical protein